MLGLLFGHIALTHATGVDSTRVHGWLSGDAGMLVRTAPSHPPESPIRLIRLCPNPYSSLGNFRSAAPFWWPLVHFFA